jgi:dihydroxyacetone kinase
MNDQPPSADQIASAIISKLLRGIVGISLAIYMIYFLGVAWESISRKHQEAEKVKAATEIQAEQQKAEDDAAARSIRTGNLDHKE